MEKESTETTPQVTNSDLANVMGYAEHPFMEVARSAQQQGLIDVVEGVRSQATKAGAEAGRAWINENALELLSQVGVVSEPSEHVEELHMQNDVTDDSLLRLLDEGGQVRHESRKNPRGVSENTLSRVGGFIAVEGVKNRITRSDIMKSLEISPATLNKAMARLRDEEFVTFTKEYKVETKPGRPHEILHPTDKMNEHIASAPDWQRAVQVFRVAEQLGCTEKEAKGYLMQLGMSSITMANNTEA